MAETPSERAFAATSLSTYSACRHAALLDREVLHGRLERPGWHDPAAELLAARGREHEHRYREQLEAQLGSPAIQAWTQIPKSREDWEHGTAATVLAMEAGHKVIYQAPLQHGGWRGIADFLIRLENRKDQNPGRLGAHHYVAVDAKLSQAVTAEAILQLCVYTAILEELQGVRPAEFRVASPAGALARGETLWAKEHVFPTADYAAYFRFVREAMAAFVREGALERVYPEPCDHCDVCRWWPRCDRRRRADDHLSLVAGMGRNHRKLLEAAGIATMEELAKVQLPLVGRPKRLPEDSLERLHNQARLQVEARGGQPTYETLPVEVDRGLCRLPAVSDGDVFLDLEADRYAIDGTFHYLFGWIEVGAQGESVFRGMWARTREEERAAFEQFIDRVVELRGLHKNMHIYHYAPFERAALGHLSLRYLSREDVVDDLLRNEVLVDLLPVVKQGLRAGVESYSLKDLEQFHGFQRKTDLRAASLARRAFELNRDVADGDLSGVVETITSYNREDCESTLSLRTWLESVRTGLVDRGVDVPRPKTKEKSVSEPASDWTRKVEDLRAELTAGIPVELGERTEGQKARLLLANLLDWHRRERKPEWWEYFRVLELDQDELIADPATLGSLGPPLVRGKVSERANAKNDRVEYHFDEQEYGIKEGDKVACPLSWVDDAELPPTYEVLEIDRKNQVIALSMPPRSAPMRALVKAASDIKVKSLQEALLEIGDSLKGSLGLQADEWDPGSLPAARALLLRTPPALAGGVAMQRANESAGAALIRVGPALKGTVLPVQGPPGSGKTYSGSRMILSLLKAGRRVGITAQSHKVISNLVHGVHEAAKEEGGSFEVRSIQYRAEEDFFEHKSNKKAKDANEVATLLRSGKATLAAGSAWLWTSPALRESVDVLVIDEAGQFSLANALAVCVAADSLVLLGDPQQLAQPSKGSHPPGAQASALEHLLDGRETVATGHGLFLEYTRRLPPGVADFTSEHFYSGLLKSDPSCAGRRVVLEGPAARFAGAGVFIEAVNHWGNVHNSSEEAERIRDMIQEILASRPRWVDEKGGTNPLYQRNILVVAPYNSQVQLIAETLATAGLAEVRVGTVDKFQGQEAPVVFYSMATSSPEDAPRGFDFLYSRNRLNVATSRSQGIVVLVANPRLLEAECRTPRQMRLVNALCGLREHAERRPT